MESALDHRFIKVDHYLSTQFQLEDDVLRETVISIEKNGMPEHSVSAVQGQFLALLAKLCNARRIVEVGTLGGYSTIWLGRALPPDGHLTSIEIDPKSAEIARQNIDRAGLTDRVTIIHGDAMEVLRSLEGNDEPVDLPGRASVTSELSMDWALNVEEL